MIAATARNRHNAVSASLGWAAQAFVRTVDPSAASSRVPYATDAAQIDALSLATLGPPSECLDAGYGDRRASIAT